MAWIVIWDAVPAPPLVGRHRDGVMTRGLRDLLEIGRQTRPHTYSLVEDHRTAALENRLPDRGHRVFPGTAVATGTARHFENMGGGAIDIMHGIMHGRLKPPVEVENALWSCPDLVDT